MWGSLLTCGAFYSEECSGSPRYIFIAGSLATALPRLGYFMQSTLAGKQKNMGHPIISGFILGFESNTCRDFYECGSNSWTGESHCNAGIYVGCFSHPAGSEIWATLDNKTSAVTCKVHCKHSISLTTVRKWSISRKLKAYHKKGNDFILWWWNGCSVGGGKDVVSIKISAS